MLVELAVGDAYGGGFEFVDQRFIAQNNDLLRYREHPKWTGQTEMGHYTDDTQMTIAIAEAVLSGCEWTKKLIADKVVECYKRDPRNSYARSFGEFLKEVKDGDDFIQKIKPNSDKSGAAMRASPVGLFPKIEEVLEKTKLQASVTHDTPDGIQSAQAAALAVHYFAYNLGNKADLGKFIEQHVPNNWSLPWNGKVGPKGWQSTKAAISVIVKSKSLSEVLLMGVALGGDVDTVCTIAMSAGSFCRELAKDIPLALIDGLEKGPYGLDFLKKLDAQLMDKFGVKKKLDSWDLL
jgi:ADP-ribosylglycohydrolase